ncbi:hypothetical protein BV22DRAFT_1049356 [Leucogyrophana mollusca]|uniref:Uncharacterized protein n=1 Tax=Leucogyrophana mollusca TaxID=85980 RepID=A0ACB8B966_9AGAM|nr:hypothetical protein BV22DRAFT_1049356 [Leucogyrophana mollusca]
MFDVARAISLAQSSNQINEKYQSEMAMFNVQGVREGAQDAERLALMVESACLSRGMDPNATTSITPEERGELLAEPVLVKMCEDHKRLLSRVMDLKVELENCKDEDIEAELKADLTATVKTAAGFKAKHMSMLERETRLCVSLAQKKYFQTASYHEPLGQHHHPLQPLQHALLNRFTTTNAASLLPGKENQDPIAGPSMVDPSTTGPLMADPSTTSSSTVNVSTSTIPSHHNNELIVALFGDIVNMDRHATLTYAINTTMGLAQQHQALSYPGESPLYDGKCPVCNTSKNSMRKGVANHIHECCTSSCFKNTTLSSNTCKATFRECITQNFWGTVNHSVNGKYPLMSAQCSAEDCNDWDAHFALEHNINTQLQPKVHFCCICCEWFHDQLEDDNHWDKQSQAHFNDLFAQFHEHASLIDIQPINIMILPDIDNCIEFECGESFHGKLPEYHDHVEGGVVFTPMMCPCLQRFHSHLLTHKTAITGVSACPVPSCGTREFSEYNLFYHMVTVHHISLCSSVRSRVQHLKLPIAPFESTHGHINLYPEGESMATISQAPTQLTPPSGALTLPVEHLDMDMEHASQPDSNNAGNIKIQGRKSNRLTSSRCLKKSAYIRREAGCDVGERVAWVEATLSSKECLSKGNHMHWCGVCRINSTNIREHINDCNCTWFKICDKNMTWNQWGPHYNRAQWNEENPAPAM